MKKLHIRTTFEQELPENYRVEKRTEENLVVCEKCKGLGVITKIFFDYHTRTESFKKEICSACKGTGKLLETNTTFSVTNLQGMALRPILKLEPLNQDIIKTLIDY